MKLNEPRGEHIKRIQERYRQADRGKKSAMLTEFCLTWNVDRKHAIWSPPQLNGHIETSHGA